MQLIDTHVHINFETFLADLAAVRERWQSSGVVRLVHSCCEPSEFDGIQALADRFPELSFAVGLHPLESRHWQPELAERIRALAASDSRVVAIGETGLDFYKADNSDEQIAACWAQLSIARDLNLPVIIHCRDAASELRVLLEKFWREVGPISGVMHCWSGTPEETCWFLDLGFYISFSGIVTFKSAQHIREAARLVPGDRLLVETDCPFLAPVPKRGKRNEPSYVRYVAEQVADLRGVGIDEVAAQTTANALALFQLAPVTPSVAPVPA
ncbi:hydrolase, TatD family [Rubidibacter lacunae KORDI 51-2]|uniref:D-aminoacyl-tRNA deacylase n=1 Tax=Rubidibacter lacunae KORDI 51-2 TaxID=582515 RepID=U5DEX6_9CHRO|nr:TatD family hydrolase [Rubidibacter lacunae]ERN39852.1 hydrolase, TatD family [Rubidibacter lacunae KORDI 51-2]